MCDGSGLSGEGACGVRTGGEVDALGGIAGVIIGDCGGISGGEVLDWGGITGGRVWYCGGIPTGGAGD